MIKPFKIFIIQLLMDSSLIKKKYNLRRTIEIIEKSNVSKEKSVSLNDPFHRMDTDNEFKLGNFQPSYITKIENRHSSDF